jgi:phage gp36-like protein
MEARFGTDEVLRASDRDGSGVVDPTAMTSCLDAATGEMDSYIAAQYDLPLGTPYSEHIEHLCCDIAMYRLSADSPAYTEEKRVRYEDAIAWLTKLAKGDVTLGENEDEEDSIQVAELSTDTETRLFTRTTQRGLW